MIKWFIRHQWKESTRSPMFQRNVLGNIFIGFFLFLMLIYLLAFGIFIDVILEEMRPGENPLDVVNGFILYYLCIDIFIRFFMQKLPELNIESYLHLPVKKKTVLHFMVSKTLMSAFNYLPLLILVPFTIKMAHQQTGYLPGLLWLVSLFFMLLANNFFGSWLKRMLASKPLYVGFFGAFLLVVMLLDYFSLINTSLLSTYIFKSFYSNYLLILLPFLWMIIAYRLHYGYLKKRLYPEEINVRRQSRSDALTNLRYLKRLGIMGDMLGLDMKLMWRHKRTRTMVYMAPFFLLYGLIFYPNEVYMNEMTGFLIFVGIFLSGGMMINYVNYAFAYESNFFDAILAHNIELGRYLKMKHRMAIAISSVFFVLSIPYVFFGEKVLWINAATYLFNMGFLSYLLLYMATYNKKRMDLSAGNAFNYQGLSASNWLAMLPAFLLPVLIYWPFNALGYPNGGLLVIASIGLLGLVFDRSIMRFILRRLVANKYAMAEAFRSK